MKVSEGEMTFLDHLEELRWHIIRSAVAVLVVAVICFVFKDYIFCSSFCSKNGVFLLIKCFAKLVIGLILRVIFVQSSYLLLFRVEQMAGQFSAHIWTSIWTGVIVAFPYVLYEVWRFISPGLYDNERKLARGFILIASILFFIGVLFGLLLITPLSVNFLGSYSVSPEVKNQIDIDSYISVVRSSVIFVWHNIWASDSYLFSDKIGGSKSRFYAQISQTCRNSSTDNSCCHYPSGCYKSNYCIDSNNVVIRSEYIYFGIRFKKRTKQGNLIF